ncbi:MAG: hypothetical protein ACM3KM_03595 [Acidobacteriaceae bacterium]
MDDPTKLGSKQALKVDIKPFYSRYFERLTLISKETIFRQVNAQRREAGNMEVFSRLSIVFQSVGIFFIMGLIFLLVSMTLKGKKGSL